MEHHLPARQPRRFHLVGANGEQIPVSLPWRIGMDCYQQRIL
jgi:hypothetical protein